MIEHGREYDDDIDWDVDGYRKCDLFGEVEVPIVFRISINSSMNNKTQKGELYK